MTTASSPIVERVKKLLALAQSDVPAERDAAIAKANALIAEHNIDMVLLQSSAQAETFGEVEFATGVKRPPVELKFIYGILKAHFRCEAYYSRRPEGLTLRIIGRKSDAEFGLWLAGFLRDEFARRWAYYRRSTGAETRVRNTFMYGMWQGLHQKLTDERRASEERRISEIAATQSDGVAGQEAHLKAAGALQDKYALAVQDESRVLAAELRRRVGPTFRRGRARRTTFRSHDALSAGMSSGRTISCNRPLAAAA